jgi:hypothetical protein
MRRRDTTLDAPDLPLGTVEQTGPMRIEKPDGASLDSVVVALTRGEAAELRDAVTDLLARFNDPSFHVHVSSADYQTELTLTSAPGA